MLARVLHDVTQGFPDRIPATNDTSVEAVGEGFALAIEEAVDRSCDADVEALHASAKGVVAAHVHQEVNVIAHHCVGSQLKVEAIFGFAEAAFERFDHVLLSQVGNATLQFDSHVHAIGIGNGWPGGVRDFAGLS